MLDRFGRFHYRYTAYLTAFGFAIGVGAGPGIIVWALTGSGTVGTIVGAIGVALAMFPGYKFARFITRQLPQR